MVVLSLLSVALVAFVSSSVVHAQGGQQGIVQAKASPKGEAGLTGFFLAPPVRAKRGMVSQQGTESESRPPVSEDVEPRSIGADGTMMLGVAAFVDRFHSSGSTLPTNYTAQIDMGRFISRTFVVRAGLAGSGSLGGDDPEERPTGAGAPALHAFGGLLYYFTPQSMVSLYSGVEYWAQLTQRAAEDAGSIVGRVGLQGAVSSRVSLFVEGGYGVGLTKGDEGELVSRFGGQLGVRLKF